MRNELLFKWCECSEYLSPVSDGCCIGKSDVDDLLEQFGVESPVEGEKGPYICYPSKYEPDKAPFYSPCEGAFDVRKYYYERKTQSFRGVVVGFRKVVVEGFLGVDTDYDPYRGEVERVFKHPDVVVECAKVYYASGKRRLVPLEAIKPVFDLREGQNA